MCLWCVALVLFGFGGIGGWVGGGARRGVQMELCVGVCVVLSSCARIDVIMIIPATCFFELAGDKICRSIRTHRRPTVVWFGGWLGGDGSGVLVASGIAPA